MSRSADDRFLFGRTHPVPDLDPDGAERGDLGPSAAGLRVVAPALADFAHHFGKQCHLVPRHYELGKFGFLVCVGRAPGVIFGAELDPEKLGEPPVSCNDLGDFLLHQICNLITNGLQLE